MRDYNKILKYIKEQFEIANYGRVEREARQLINSNEPVFIEEGLLYQKFY